MGEISSSSARVRRKPPSSVLLWVVAVVAALVVFLVATWSEEDDPPPTQPVPTHAPVVSPTPLLPTPTPSPSPTPTVVSDPEPTPTPTPTPTLIPLPTRRPRRVQAEPPQCIEFRWMITPNSPSLGHNVVEIEVNNRCDRDLQPDDLWFEACGFRDGGLVHSARARSFEGVKRNNRVTLAFDLPGSVDWYDDIKVEWQACYP